MTRCPKAIRNIKLSITSEPFLQTKSYLETQHTKQVRVEAGVGILKFHQNGPALNPQNPRRSEDHSWKSLSHGS